MVGSLPITKTKIASITNAAVRAIKYYKHVVKLVEDFILKSTASFKVPGLYVVDAILRHSRLCNRDGDPYGPRFLRNIDALFAALSHCNPEDKPVISRILQLWRKENVYSEDLISILQDLVYEPTRPDVRATGTVPFEIYFSIARRIISNSLAEYETKQNKGFYVSKNSEEYLRKAIQVCQNSQLQF